MKVTNMTKQNILQYVVLFILSNTVATLYVRNATTKTTCGLPPEQYFKSWQVDLNPRHRIPFVCNASDQFNWHPLEYAFDRRLDTFWQSTAGEDKAVIIVDITSDTNEFLYVHNISLAFGDSQRPGQMKFYRSSDGGKSFSTWEYIVSLPFECSSVFGVNYQETPFNVDDVLCIKYPSLIPKKSNESVSINLSGGRGGGNLGLQSWLKATHVKIEFSGLHRLFDAFSQRWHHYNVREINIETNCFCNGHASRCSDPYNNGSHVCECENNACGEQCDQCCPAFNQRKWKPGNLNPFEVDTKAACEACNCHNHSNVCIFNDTIANMSMSLDMFGNYSGGGVCENCQQHTTGTNCQSCETFYYNPHNIDMQSNHACQLCRCNVNGSRNEPGYKLLDCVKKSFNEILNMTAGDCFCKGNVNGSKCNQCKRGFYNLTLENPDGCDNCQCSSIGTEPLDISCLQESGQCNCKSNVVGLQCDVCKDGFFNLTTESVLGCNDCLCNLGGSKTHVCDKQLGNCSCHTDTIIGRKCDGLADQFYYPSLHFLQDTTLERSSQIIKAWQGKLTLLGPHLRNYFKFVFQCSSEVSVDAIITYRGVNHYLSDQVKVDGSCRDCYISTKSEVIVDSSQVFVDIMFPSIASGNKVTCNKLIGIPRQFYNSSAVRNRDEFYEKCNVITNNVTNAVCHTALFTLTMDYLQRPLPCNCNTTGSVNNSCAKYMGQCQCKQAVTGRTCNKCQAGFYNFTINGCNPCNCFGTDSVCNIGTGQCSCARNTEGRTCNTCTEFHWNITKTDGCQPCNCSSTGATNGRCNTTSGQCECRRGVEGRECHTCSPGYKQFSLEGCKQCNCSGEGSVGNVCDSASGQCPCKNNTVGLLCDQCKAGTYYMDEANQNGCLDCYCMGITKTCTMATGHRVRVESNFTDWTVGSRNTTIGSIILYEESRRIGASGVDIAMFTASIYTHQQVLFWRMTNNFFDHYGVSAYGGTIQWYSEISIDEARITQEIQRYILLQGTDNTTYHHSLNQSYYNTIEKHRVVLRETHWRNEHNNTVSRKDLLKLLARPGVNVFISASPVAFAMFGYHSRIGDIFFTPLEVQQIDDLSNDVERNAVENCSCLTSYTGLSCEKCQKGFYHSSEGNSVGVSVDSFRSCTPCNCNSHASDCNKESGICIDCQHNTFGESCESCLPGYYGNATQGSINACRACPCNGPYTRTNLCVQSPVTAGNITCLNCSVGYTGRLCDGCADGFYRDRRNGFCIPCECNNNSQQCDKSTGHCIDCDFNTTGNSCEECENGWFGNARNQSCNACECDSNGSMGSGCNNQGQCQCKQNVVGTKCFLCAERSYGFNNVSGCTSCNCSAVGSTSLQCDSNGVCSCGNYSAGVKCDHCIDGHWGLPMQTCAECNCNATGSVNASCSAFSGQCICKPGIAGRTCDSCMKQHLNFSSTGCDECSGCTKLLQKKADRLSVTLNQMVKQTSTLEELKSTGHHLNDLSRNISSTQEFENHFSKRLNVLEKGVNMMKNTLNSSIPKLQTQIVEAQSNLTKYASMATNETQRIADIQRKSESAFQKVIDANISVTNVFSEFDSALVESSKYLESVTNNKNNASNFRNKFNISDEILNQINATTLEVSQEIFKSINDSDSLATRLETVTDDATIQKENTTLLESVYQGIANTHNTLRNTIRSSDAIYRQSSTDGELIKASLNNIKGVIENNFNGLYGENATLNNITEIISDTEWLLTNSTGNLIVIKNSTGSMRFLEVTEAYQSMMEFPQMLYENVVSIANNFTNYSEQITSTFAPAEKHGTNLLSLLQRIKDMQTIINSTLVMQNVTNYTTLRIHDKLSVDHLKNLSQLIGEIKSSNSESSKKIQELQDVYNDLAANVSRISATARNATVAMDSIHDFYPRLLNQTEWNRNAYAECEEKLMAARNNISLAIQYLDYQNRTMILFENVTDMSATLQHTNETYINTTQMLKTARNFTMKARDKLNDSQTILESIDAAVKINNQFNASKESLETRLSLLRNKLAQLKLTVAKVKAPVKFSGGDPISKVRNITLTGRFFEVQIEFKTTQQNALLLKLRQPGQVGYVKAWIDNSLVAIEYETENGRFANKNWEIPVSDGTWKKIYFSRMDNSSRLTVTSLKDDFSQTYVKYPTNTSSVDDVSPYIQSIEMQLGGKDNDLSAFVGCVSSVVVNGEDIPLLDDVTHGRIVCNARVPSTPLLSGGASFSGNGLLVQQPGNFSVNSDFRVEITFRTLKENGTLFQVVHQNKKTLVLLTLLDGHLIYSVSFNKTSALLRSKQSTYANGHVFKVHAGVLNGNLSMNVHDNSSRIIEALSHAVSTRDARLEGTLMYLGGNNNSKSSFFAGCILSLSLSDDEGNIQQRSLDSVEMLSSTGVLFNSCLKNVENGIRFNEGSFSNISAILQDITTFSLTFKTARFSGTILSFYTQDTLFYLALYHGNIYIQHGNISTYSTDQMLNDGTYHTLFVELSPTNISFVVDGNVKNTMQTSYNSRAQLSNVVLGYNQQLKFTALPVMYGLVGDVTVFDVNGISYLGKLVENGHMISADGVSPPKTNLRPTHPATVPPTTKPPPSCAQTAKPLEWNNETAWVGFQGDTLLALHPTQGADMMVSFFAINYVITLEFRSIVRHGVLFFASNNKSVAEEMEYVAVELVDGRIAYHFNAGGGVVRITTNNVYATGEWIKVFLIRISQFGAILVSNTEEYHNNRTGNKFEQLDIKLPLYLGGVPDHVNTSVLYNGVSKFHGCIRTLEIAETTNVKKLNLRGDMSSTESKNLRSCYVTAKPQLSFRGNGYAMTAVNISTSLMPFKIDVRIRTTSYDGLIWQLHENISTRLSLVQSRGELELIYDDGVTGVTNKYFSWQHHNTTWQNTSYYLCDGTSRTVTVDRIGNFFRLFIDDQFLVVSTTPINKELNGSFYVAGSPSSTTNDSGFKGCIEELRFHGDDVNLALLEDTKNVVYGCTTP